MLACLSLCGHDNILRPRGLTFISHSSGGWKSKTEVLADSESVEGSFSWLALGSLLAVSSHGPYGEPERSHSFFLFL